VTPNLATPKGNWQIWRVTGYRVPDRSWWLTDCPVREELYTWAILIDPNISVSKPSTETWFGQKLSRTMGAIHLYYWPWPSGRFSRSFDQINFFEYKRLFFKITAVNYAISNVKFPVLSEFDVKNKGLLFSSFSTKSKQSNENEKVKKKTSKLKCVYY